MARASPPREPSDHRCPGGAARMADLGAVAGLAERPPAVQPVAVLGGRDGTRDARCRWTGRPGRSVTPSGVCSTTSKRDVVEPFVGHGEAGDAAGQVRPPVDPWREVRWTGRYLHGRWGEPCGEAGRRQGEDVAHQVTGPGAYVDDVQPFGAAERARRPRPAGGRWRRRSAGRRARRCGSARRGVLRAGRSRSPRTAPAPSRCAMSAIRKPTPPRLRRYLECPSGSRHCDTTCGPRDRAPIVCIRALPFGGEGVRPGVDPGAAWASLLCPYGGERVGLAAVQEAARRCVLRVAAAGGLPALDDGRSLGDRCVAVRVADGRADRSARPAPHLPACRLRRGRVRLGRPVPAGRGDSGGQHRRPDGLVHGHDGLSVPLGSCGGARL